MTIDFKKAFDMLRWDAIDYIMELLGFDNIFREIIMSCLSLVLSALEGSLMVLFNAQRGVR